MNFAAGSAVPLQVLPFLLILNPNGPFHKPLPCVSFLVITRHLFDLETLWKIYTREDASV